MSADRGFRPWQIWDVLGSLEPTGLDLADVPTPGAIGHVNALFLSPRAPSLGSTKTAHVKESSYKRSPCSD